MIVDIEVEIIVNNHNLNHYKLKGYACEYRKKIKVNPLDLTIGSHYKINVKCDICLVDNIVEFRQLKGSSDYLCSSCASKNKKKTIYTEEQIKKMVQKMIETKKIRKESDQNYGKVKNPKPKIEKVKKQRVKKTKKEISEIIIKRKKTKLEKYGDENFNNQNKKKKTLKEKYGDENFNNTMVRKISLKEKYGDENFNNQHKKELTCISKYGVRHSNQDPDTMRKIQISSLKLKFHDKMKIHYRGSYEKHFLDFCFDNNIEVSNFEEKLFYEYLGKTHRYFPDFYHRESNTIIEIKSTFTFEKDYDINLLKEKCAKEKYNFLFIIDKNYSEFISYI